MTKCAWCKEDIGRGDPHSHGICPSCTAKISPSSPDAIRYRKARAKWMDRSVVAGTINMVLMSMLDEMAGATK
jgi:hypothetical protein